MHRFIRNLIRQFDSHAVDRIVVDLRFNTGGDLHTGRRYFDMLAGHEALQRPHRVFVITGPATFSAGIFHAAQLKQFTTAIVVGGEVGDDLDFWAEGRTIELPNTGLLLRTSDRFHSYSKEPAHVAEDLLYMDLDVDTLTPSVSVSYTSQDFFAGRDPALEAIIAFAP